MFINGGIIVASLLGQFFQETPVSTDEYWRFVFLFPLILAGSRMLCILIFFNHETPFYYILKDDMDGCKKFVSDMYRPEYVESTIEYVKQQVEKQSKQKAGYLDMF